ncbi:MAG: hypothetical protein HRT77_14970 [Halioglobus sp.]|nr:hypothetical protein [Halioglobus sp.]
MFAIVWSEKGLLTLACLFLVAIVASPAAADSRWYPPQFILKKGALSAANALVTDAAGDAAFGVPTDGQLLEDSPVLRLTLTGPPPARVMIYWRTAAMAGRYAQVEVAAPVEGTSTYNLERVNGWSGAAEELGFAFRAEPHQSIAVRSVALSQFSLFEILKAYWHQWDIEKSWAASDINFLTGTREFSSPLYPVPVFAGLTGLALVVFALGSLSRGFARPFNWHIVGGIILTVWVVSDAFWQARLWHQVNQTWEKFGRKTAEEKLLASDDAPLVVLAAKARQRISEHDARVFIASSVDVVGMLSAYYMSPFNTFWHRRGPELPAGDVFEPGDYILVVRPSQVDYDARAGTVRRPGDAVLNVRQIYANDSGALLKVI